MKENLVVYEALRAHILQKQNQIANETIYMYVTYFALLTVGSIWDNWIYLLSFLTLIVFQSLINSDQWAITRASVYIRIFFEEKHYGIHWESLHQDSDVFSGAIIRTIGWYFSKCGATILSLISFIYTFFTILHEVNYQLNSITFYLAAKIIFAFFLCMLTIHVNIQYFSSRDEQGVNLKKFTEAVRDFYEKSYPQ